MEDDKQGDHGTSQSAREGASTFPWYGLRWRAQGSRWWAAIGLAVSGAIMATAYLSVNAFASARGVTAFDPASLFVIDGRSLDSRIPYLPWTVLVYTSVFYASFVLSVFAYPKTAAGARQLFALYSGLVAITLAACAVFLVWPAEMVLRHGAVGPRHTGSLHGLNLMLRAVDQPFNTWPCLHAAQSALIFLVVGRWSGRRSVIAALWVAWIALVLSTLTTKQHFLFDLLTGSLLAVGYWRWRLRR
ncbi:phosphatase PAP2 family protein [Engelhardtia mirabilis]